MTDIYSFVKSGDPALDFANSKIMDVRTEPYLDLFTNYENVVHWCRHLHIVEDDEVEKLFQLARQNPDTKQSALNKFIALRDASYGLMTAFARQQESTPENIETLNQILNETIRSRILVSTPEGITWTWKTRKDSLDWMAGPLAFSIAELLTSENAKRIRECGGCYWLFLDTSRNGMRRWCNMKTCGNRAKAHRHYERRKSINQ